MHGGATPRGERHGAFICGEYTTEAIADRRKAAALLEEATALLIEAIRARTDVARKLFRGELLPKEAKKQHKAIEAQLDAAFAMRKEAVALKHAWIDRYHGQRED